MPAPMVLLTGMSGAGRSTAAKVLEDDGHLVVEALPPGPLAALLAALPAERPTVVVTDLRAGDPLTAAGLVREAARAAGRPLQHLHLEAGEATLRRRYAETRRPHPADRGDGTDLGALIDAERAACEPLLGPGTVRIGSDGMSPADLAIAVRAAVGGGAVEPPVVLVSFGFREGQPDANLVLDARVLPNPHWVPALRPGDGRDPAVADHALDNPVGRAWIGIARATIAGMRALSGPERGALVVAIGCTGGRHRSVAAVERLATLLAAEAVTVRVRHRDLAPRA